jgi:clumping factor A
MSGPYNQQQVYSQGFGYVGGMSGGQFGEQAVGQTGGQFGGQAGGQTGGQFVGQAGGQTGGQTVTHTSSVKRSAEIHYNQPAGSSSRGERHRRQLNESGSSSASDHAYKVNVGAGAGVVAGGADGASTAYQQYSAESHYAYGGAAGGLSVADGGSSGSFSSGQRRQGRHKREVIRLPDQAQGQVRRVCHRMPTPEPDTLERV